MLAQSLISLTLVVAQTLSWAGGTLFVCVDEAGAVCIDGGPRDCECRASHEEPERGCCSDRSTQEPAPGPSGCLHEIRQVSAAPCGCDHELMTQQAAKASQVRGIAVDHWLHAGAWTTCAVDRAAHSDELLCSVVEYFAGAIRPTLGGSGSVVLRC